MTINSGEKLGSGGLTQIAEGVQAREISEEEKKVNPELAVEVFNYIRETSDYLAQMFIDMILKDLDKRDPERVQRIRELLPKEQFF